jgi:hypothetical protein
MRDEIQVDCHLQAERVALAESAQSQARYANAKLQSERESVTDGDSPEWAAMTEAERIDLISNNRTQGRWGITPVDVAFMDADTNVIQ